MLRKEKASLISLLGAKQNEELGEGSMLQYLLSAAASRVQEGVHLYGRLRNLKHSFHHRKGQMSVSHSCFMPVLICSAAVTEHQRQGGLNNRNSFSHSPRGWNPKGRMPSWLVSDETLLPGFQAAASLPGLSSVCEDRVGSGVPSSHNDTNLNRLGLCP